MCEISPPVDWKLRNANCGVTHCTWPGGGERRGPLVADRSPT